MNPARREPRGVAPGKLTVINGVLYGTVVGGKKSCVPSAYYPCGMIFSLTPSGDYRILYHFKGPFPIGSDGVQPNSLIAYNGMLYGTTAYGGTTGNGTIFSLTTSGRERVLYSLQGGSDGSMPISLTAMNGRLYGMSYGGNTSNCSYDYVGCGTVFSVTTEGRHRVLYHFQGGSDGWKPSNALTAFNGKLYGTTQWGGGCGFCGTIFSITPDGRERVLYTFPQGNGVAGYGGSGLTPVNETLYGTMPGQGGSAGVFFAFTP